MYPFILFMQAGGLLANADYAGAVPLGHGVYMHPFVRSQFRLITIDTALKFEDLCK